ncbi:MAG: tripartite tricarboxylate transporter substrate binding protein, partial [Actinobacteria bacterium]|nr:tripartite tricarboxylate transporter substrate binding protein [Actinomycetota bacterium]
MTPRSKRCPTASAIASASTAVQPLVLVAHPSTGFKNVGDMVQAVKAGKAVSYGSPGAGSP